MVGEVWVNVQTPHPHTIVESTWWISLWSMYNQIIFALNYELPPLYPENCICCKKIFKKSKTIHLSLWKQHKKNIFVFNVYLISVKKCTHLKRMTKNHFCITFHFKGNNSCLRSQKVTFTQWIYFNHSKIVKYSNTLTFG